MTTFFTADTHFDHANIIHYSNRPFASVEEMNEALIERWNKVVRPTDTVWHLGDFAFSQVRQRVEHLVSRLNGMKSIVWGNHDKRGLHYKANWNLNHDITEIKVNGEHVVLCHYPMRSWNRQSHGSYMLYGHVHGTTQSIRRSLDVGVDCWSYAPVSFDEVVERLKPLD